MKLLQRLLQFLPRKGRERITRNILQRLRNADARINGHQMNLDLRDYIQRSLYLGVYEVAEQRRCRQVLKPGDAVIDVGANCGGFLSLFASAVGASGSILGYEPNPRLRGKLEEFLFVNQLNNIELRYLGLSDTSGELQLYMPPPENCNEDATMASVDGFIPINVRVTTLDEELKSRGQRDFRLLKIDVEGMEHRILSGAKETLSSGAIQYLLVEFNSHWLEMQGSSCQKLLEYILSTGYCCLNEPRRFQSNELYNLWFEHSSFASRSRFSS